MSADAVRKRLRSDEVASFESRTSNRLENSEVRGSVWSKPSAHSLNWSSVHAKTILCLLDVVQAIVDPTVHVLFHKNGSLFYSC